ncbi:O-antigen ligase family protein [Vibrio sp. PNB23_22_6]
MMSYSNQAHRCDTSPSILWDCILALPVMVWVFGGQLIAHDAYKALVGLVVLSVLISIWRCGLHAMWHRYKSSRWVQVLSLLVVTAVLYKEYNGGVSNALLRGYAVAFLFFLALPKYMASRLLSNLEWFLLLVSIVLCVNAVLYHYVWMVPRSLWVINAIPFTTISASVAMLAFVRGMWQPDPVKLYVNVSALTLSFNSLIMGQSRGTILAFFVALIVVFWFSWFQRVGTVRRLGLMLVLMAGSMFLNMNAIIERSEETQREVESIQANDTHTSIGIRLGLWQISVHSLMEKPLVGLGEHHEAHRRELADEGIIAPAFIRWDHYHNQYIDTLVRRGVVGAGLLILIIFGSLMRWRELSSESQLSIGSIVVVYAVSGLTDVPFDHVQTLLVFLFVLSLYELAIPECTKVSYYNDLRIRKKSNIEMSSNK